MEIEKLVARHAGWIRMKAAAFYSDKADADDLAGETIFKCLNDGHRFDASRSFKPWAYTIMVNTYKVQYNRRKCVLFTGYDETCNALSDQRTDNYAVMRSMLSVIRDCMRRSRRIECVLLYAKGYDYAEIADIMKIPVGTVKSRIAAGRRILRSALLDDKRQ